jgi:hypothetical protein
MERSPHPSVESSSPAWERESGGYTVLATDHNIRVKASGVFRNNFAGKVNRQATETVLGPWTPASTSIQTATSGTAKRT